MNWYRYDAASNLIVYLHVQTGAKNTETVGLHGNALKIRLAAVPVDGKANAVLVKFFAKQFAVPVCKITLKQGDKSKHKVMVIHQPGLDPSVLFSNLKG